MFKPAVVRSFLAYVPAAAGRIAEVPGDFQTSYFCCTACHLYAFGRVIVPAASSPPYKTLTSYNVIVCICVLLWGWVFYGAFPPLPNGS